MKMSRLLIAAFVITFVAGATAGYLISQKGGQERGDLRGLLKSITYQIEKIEKENRALKVELDNAKLGTRQAADVARQNQAMKEGLDKAQQENKALGAEVDRLRAELAGADKGVKAEAGQETRAGDLKGRLAELERENEELRSLLYKIRYLTKGEEGTTLQGDRIGGAEPGKVESKTQ